LGYHAVQRRGLGSDRGQRATKSPSTTWSCINPLSRSSYRLNAAAGMPFRPFVREWDDLLSLPPDELTSKLISRDREMVRIRNSSPFYLCEGVDFGDYNMRIRIRRAARRIAERGLAGHPTPRKP
jgi:hypothetical protein